MWARATASRVLRAFADDRRRVISDWRIAIAARRLAHAENAPLPGEKQAVEIRKELVARGDLEPAPGVPGVYVVTTPYANLLEVSEEQLVQEADPLAVFGFLTAMLHHGLTDLLPTQVHAIHFKAGGQSARVPLGTTPDDWAELAFPTPRQVRRLGDIEVGWTTLRAEWEFGIEVGYSAGLPVYVTDRERTLLDALRMPEKSGGIAKVLAAWRSAEGVNVDRLVDYTDRFGIQNFRQRVGFVLERLGRSHPTLERWRSGLQRGGSLKLLASEPYADTFSADWNLSLNVPPSVLALLDEAEG